MLTENQLVRKIVYLLVAIIAILFIILLLLTQAPATFIIDNSFSLHMGVSSSLGALRDALMGVYIGAPLLQRGLRVRPPLSTWGSYYDISSSSIDTGRNPMNDHPNGDRTDADVPDEEILYQEIPDAELEVAAIGGRVGVDTGNGKPTSTQQCCSYGKC